MAKIDQNLSKLHFHLMCFHFFALYHLKMHSKCILEVIKAISIIFSYESGFGCSNQFFENSKVTKGKFGVESGVSRVDF